MNNEAIVILRECWFMGQYCGTSVRNVIFVEKGDIDLRVIESMLKDNDEYQIVPIESLSDFVNNNGVNR